MCICKCCFKLDFTENADPQTSQENGFSPVCERMWLCKTILCENVDPHNSQGKGFFPVCVCIWVFKLESSENADPQTLQENAFSSACVSISVFTSEARVEKSWLSLFFEIKCPCTELQRKVFSTDVNIQIHALDKNILFLLWIYPFKFQDCSSKYGCYLWIKKKYYQQTNKQKRTGNTYIV